jgi:hypothetical protein
MVPDTANAALETTVDSQFATTVSEGDLWTGADGRHRERVGDDVLG